MNSERDVAAQDYWSIVLRQLRKSRLGLFGLAVVAALYVLAVFAPFLAESKPIRLVHANPDDKTCTICSDLGLSTRRVTLSDGRVFMGRIVRNTPDALVFEHDGIQESFDRKALAPRLETLPRRHDPVVSWPLLSALEPVDLYLLVSLLCLALGIPLFLVLRRPRTVQECARCGEAVVDGRCARCGPGETRQAVRVRPRATALSVVLALAASIAGAAAVCIHAIRTPMLHKLNQVDFRVLAEKRLRPGDSAWWPLIRYSTTDQDKRVIQNARPSWMAVAPVETDNATKVELDPGLWLAARATHVLGTDNQRRDIAARLIHATRISLSVGFVSVAIYVTIGIIAGSLAGYFSGWVDAVIMRIIEIIMCFPTLFLIITILAVVDKPNIFIVMAVIAAVGWTGVARLVRAEFLKLRRQDFVQAARALGASRGRIIFRHVLPNALSPVFVSATFGIAGAILTEGTLSFLGIGVPIDTATWGNVLRLARGVAETSPWEALWPGLCIFATVTSFNLFGEAMRDAMDPRLKT